jgi:hypothetical protein
MTKVKLFLTIVALSVATFSANAVGILSVNPTLKVVPASAIGNTPTNLSKEQKLQFMKWFTSLTPKEYGAIRGKKLNFFEKVSFKLVQYRMKQQLKSAYSDGSDGPNWGGLALGFFLGLLGVLGAYIFSDDSNFIKWTWIGCGIWIVLVLLIII